MFSRVLQAEQLEDKVIEQGLRMGWELIWRDFGSECKQFEMSGVRILTASGC